MHHGRAEGDGAQAEAKCDSDRRDAIHWRVLDRGIRHSRRSWSGSVPGECAGHEEPTGTKKRRAGESMADEAVILGPGGPRNFMKITQSQARMQKAWSGEV